MSQRFGCAQGLREQLAVLDDVYDGDVVPCHAAVVIDGETLCRKHALERLQATMSASTHKSTAFIQWKGTDVCLDLECSCGALVHLDGRFAYAVRCIKCNSVYEMPSTMVVEPIPDVPAGATHTPDGKPIQNTTDE